MIPLGAKVGSALRVNDMSENETRTPTVDEVIKGLECCIKWEDLRGAYPECESCPFAEDDYTCESMDKMHRAALDLIKSQQIQIDRLRAECQMRTLKEAFFMGGESRE